MSFVQLIYRALFPWCPLSPLALMFFLPPLLQSPLSIREGGVNMFRTEPSVGTYSQHHGVTMELHLLLLTAKKTLSNWG